MSDQHEYYDEDGNPVPADALDAYEEVVEPAPAERPALAASPVAAAVEPKRGGSGGKIAVAIFATAAVLVGGGFAGVKTGVINLDAVGSNPAASSAAPTTSAASHPSAETAPSTSSAASSAATTTTETAGSGTPVAVDNGRYASAKWPLSAVKKPGVRLRVTDSVKLPASSGMWDANVAKAFDRFAPWVTIAATGPNQVTVQTVTRAERTKPWAESVVSTSGKPRVTSENSGDNVDDSKELVDTDGSPAADTGPETGKPVSYYVEGGEVPTAAKGKRSGMVQVSVVKRDGQAKDTVWFVAGGTLFKAVVEDMSGSGADAAATEEDTKESK